MDSLNDVYLDCVVDDRRSMNNPDLFLNPFEAYSAPGFAQKFVSLEFLVLLPVPVQKEVPGCSVSIRAHEPLYKL